MRKTRQLGRKCQAYASRSLPPGYPPTSAESSSASAIPLLRAVTVPATHGNCKVRVVWLETAAPATPAIKTSRPFHRRRPRPAVNSPREHAPPVLAEGGATVLLRLAESVLGQRCCPAKDEVATAWPYYWVPVHDAKEPVPDAGHAGSAEPSGVRTAAPVDRLELKGDAGAEAAAGDGAETGLGEKPGLTGGDTTDPSPSPSKPETTRPGAEKCKTSRVDDSSDADGDGTAPLADKRRVGPQTESETGLHVRWQRKLHRHGSCLASESGHVRSASCPLLR